jgi:hypothetical protein
MDSDLLVFPLVFLGKSCLEKVLVPLVLASSRACMILIERGAALTSSLSVSSFLGYHHLHYVYCLEPKWP